MNRCIEWNKVLYIQYIFFFIIIYVHINKYNVYIYIHIYIHICFYMFIQFTINDSISFGKSEQRTARHAAQFRVLRYRDDSAIVAWLAGPRAELNPIVESN